MYTGQPTVQHICRLRQCYIKVKILLRKQNYHSITVNKKNILHLLYFSPILLRNIKLRHPNSPYKSQSLIIIFLQSWKGTNHSNQTL
jgi:hypothetical protein